MNDTEKTAYINGMLGESLTSTITNPYLTKAKWAIFNRMYPMGVPSTVTEVPEKYEITQCDLAVRYYLRKGAEGEISHTENGIGRAYGSVNDEDILREVLQVIRV